MRNNKFMRLCKKFQVFDSSSVSSAQSMCNKSSMRSFPFQWSSCSLVMLKIRANASSLGEMKMGAGRTGKSPERAISSFSSSWLRSVKSLSAVLRLKWMLMLSFSLLGKTNLVKGVRLLLWKRLLWTEDYLWLTRYVPTDPCYSVHRSKWRSVHPSYSPSTTNFQPVSTPDCTM